MSVPQVLEWCELRRGATASVLRGAEEQLRRPLPEDYETLLRESDGFEGFIARDVYVSFWSAADLASLNDGYAVAELMPGVTLLGTDGGNTGYGYIRNGEETVYVSVPLVGMESSAVTVLGNTMSELLEKVAAG